MRSKLKELHERLGSLLDDPEYGMASHMMMLSRTLMEMADYAGHGYVSKMPEAMLTLKAFVEPWSKGGEWQSKLTYTTFDNARNALAAVEGRSP